MFKPLKKYTLSEKVANQLLKLIREGHFQVGDKLPGERELADSLAVNRGTLREALKALEFMRVVDKRMGEGVYVRDFAREASVDALVLQFIGEDGLDGEAVGEVVDALICIESSMTRLAALRRTEAELSHLRALLGELQDGLNLDSQEFAVVDQKFHLFMGEMSKSPVLLRTASSMWQIVRRYVVLLHEIKECREKTLEHHQKVLQLISSKEELAAAEAMENHLLWAYHVLIKK